MSKLERLAEEWSTEYVQFTLERHPDTDEKRRRFLVNARHDTPAGKEIWFHSPSGFPTLEKAAEFAAGIAKASHRRGPLLWEYRGH